jgi:hypothetical protein
MLFHKTPVHAFACKFIRRFSLISFGVFSIVQGTSAQYSAPDIEWQISLGGSKLDNAQEVIESSDGGYLIVGHTESTDFEATGNHGNGDAWLVKLDASGAYQWHRCYGGKKYDRFNSIARMADGNYLLCGQTSSSNGDVAGLHGESDIWLVIIDESGNLLWQKCFGGSSLDRGSQALQTTDGSIVVFGQTFSTDGDVTPMLKGRGDIWLFKADTAGYIVWQKVFGGTGSDFGYNIRQTLDGGFIAISYTTSTGGDIIGNHGSGDGFVQKLDSAGNVQWQKCIGGSLDDYLHSVEQLPTGEYVICGRSLSGDGDITGHHDNGRSKDYILTKLDSDGTILWLKCYGGTKDDCSYYFAMTEDNGFVLAGHSYSNDGDVSGNHLEGEADYWIVKVDANANIQWQKCMGGTGHFGENPYAIIRTSEGGFLVVGRSDSKNGDLTANHGREDMWAVKLMSSALPTNTILTGTISPLSFVAGAEVTVPFSATGIFMPDNIFSVELSDNEGRFTSPQVIGTLTSTEPSDILCTIPLNTLAGDAYRIRVVSSNPHVVGSPNVFNISIAISPDACTIPDGLESSGILSASTQLNWNPVAIATDYRVRYKISGNNPWTNISTTSHSVQLADLLPSTTYVWQVRTICQALPLIGSDWSPQVSFTTAQLRVENAATDFFECYPNPSQGLSIVTWKQPVSGFTRLDLFGALNQHIGSIVEEFTEAGIYRRQIDLSNLNSGIYYLRLRSNGMEVIRMLVIE